jgi:hypothetical protein
MLVYDEADKARLRIAVDLICMGFENWEQRFYSNPKFYDGTIKLFGYDPYKADDTTIRMIASDCNKLIFNLLFKVMAEVEL